MTDPYRSEGLAGESDTAPTAPSYGGADVSGDSPLTTGEPTTTSGDASDRDSGREMMRQLQSMIDNLATQAAPVMRQIGAKAAELAALAGEKAGPIAHRAAEATEAAGTRLASKGREVAADLRTREGRDGGLGEGAGAGDRPNTIETADTPSADR